MSERKRPIYRAKALQRYAENRQQAVLPRLVSAPTVAVLWILVLLLGVAGYFAWSTPVPVYSNGIGVLVVPSEQTPGVQGDIAALILTSPDTQARLSVGEPVSIAVGANGERVQAALVSIEPDILGPDEIVGRYALNPAAAQFVTGPRAVAVAQFDASAIEREQINATYAGSVGEARIETANRRVASYLPVIGKLFD